MTATSVALTPRVERRYALTRLQQQIWASQRLYPDSPLANMGAIHRIAGPIDPNRFVEAFDTVVRACDALRTVVDGRPGSVSAGDAIVLASPPRRTEVIDLPAADVESWCSERIARPIDAAVCSYDSVLLRHADDDWTWWLDLHHLVTDATSQSLVHRLTSDAYEGLDVAESSFAEMAERLEAETEAPGTDSTSPTADTVPLQLFGGRGPTTTASPSRRLRIEGIESTELTAAALGAFPSISPDLSLASVCASALACTMQRLDGRSEYVVGFPVGNRSDRRRRELVGPLMELHPIRVAIEPGDTFRSLVERTMTGLIAMLRDTRRGGAPAHQDFEMVVNVFRVEYGTFAGHPEIATWKRAPHVDPAHSVRLHAFDHGNDLELEVDVNEAVACGDERTRLDTSIARTLAAMLGDPDARVDTMSLAVTDDLDALAELIPVPPDGAGLRPVHELVRDRLAARPDWIVAEDDHGAVSAAAFDRRVESCRAGLGSLGVGHGDRVGLRMVRSIDLLVAVHAVLRSGAAFVMLDPSDPDTRHDAIAADAGLRTIIDDIAELASHDEISGHDTPSVGLDDTAYVLYTSGSTGLPKGVPISHRGLADYLEFAAASYVSETGPPVVALHSAPVFDLTITSMFLSFVTGGSVVVVDGDPVAALGRIADDERITFLKATPSQLEIFTRLVTSRRRIRTVVVGGEAFRRPVAVATAEACAPDVRIFNEYGPTEAVVGCMIHEWDPSADLGPDVPIGGAAPGCEITVLDQFGHPAVRGTWGELYVRRVGMADGYIDRPQLTAERFVALGPVPGALGGGERGPWYRTGDRVRLVRPGVLVYGGRLDDQMKVNGVRLEPAEVEAALVEHPRVASAVVRLWTPSDRVSDTRCARCGLGTDVPGVDIDGTGVCSMCHAYERVAPQTEAWFKTEADLDARLADARRRSTGDYDCLHLLSGGKDSSYALYQLVERGWRVHALTLDNGFISEGAKDNIRRSVDALGITHEFATTEEMNEIFRDSLERHSNVCQGCYKTIYTKAVARADELGIPVVVTGLSRGQFFETRLIPAQFEAGRFDPDAIDAAVLEARKVYHHVPDAVTRLLPEQRVFADDSVFERIEFVDFYRYVDVDLAELYRYLEENAPWVRPADTGRSTNCLINVAGIQVHQAERGYHNYAEPYSWDVRLGHKTRSEALDELDDQVDGGVDNAEVRRLLDIVGYRPKHVEILTAWYQTDDGDDVDPDELRRHVRERLASAAVPAAFVRIDEVPLAASAKVDAAALPAPARVHRQGSVIVEPSSAIEGTICEIWGEVLQIDNVGVTDDFFDLGGDSLAALEVVAAMSDTMGTTLDDAAVFHARTVRELAALLDVFGATTRADGDIAPVDGAPLSAGEEAMLFDHRRDPDDVRYNVTRSYRLPLDVDLERLDSAIRDVAMVHGPLHTAFDAARSDLGRDGSVLFERVTASTATEFAAFADRQRRVPFDLDRGPLVRVHAATIDDASDESHTAVLIGMHHISVDAGTFDVFWEQVDTRYSGGDLVEPAASYAAHGEWQRREVHPAHASFWAEERRRADALPTPGALAVPAPVPPEPDGYVERGLDITTSELRRAPGRTPFVTALTAAAAVVGRYSGTPHVEMGITASVRDHPAASSLVGYFLNTIPIRIDAPGSATFSELATSADGLVARAVEHRTYPFASIVRDARAAGVRPPDVSAMLAYERLAPASLDGATVSHRILPSGTSVADLTLFVQERGESIAIGLEYAGHVMSSDDAQRVLDSFGALLTGAVTAPDDAVSSFAPADMSADLEGPELPASAPTVVHELVDRCAADPHAAAVVDAAGVTLSRVELLGRALATADALGRAGGPVGICVRRSADVVVAIVAAQLAGRGYVPLDPDSPTERLASIRAAVELSAVIADGDNRDRFPSSIGVAADSGLMNEEAIASARERLEHIRPHDTAYVIFTSGSTGRPRGVTISHANLAASTAARQVTYDDPPGRFLVTSSIGFDSSIVGLFWPLVSGGTIVLPDDRDVHDVDRLAELIEATSVTHVLMVPSLYRAVLRRGGARLTSLRTAIVAGEECAVDVAELHRSVLPSTKLFDEYGPTEATVWSTVHEVTADDRASIPIGRPIAGVTLRVADRTGRATPSGVAGELLVGGPTVAAGYLDDPVLTAERFVERSGRRWYRTGDLVRVDRRGLLEFLGRIDDQLNVGGARVEPGEVERALLAACDATAAVVVASSEAGGRLVAHVEADRIDEAAVRRRLGDILPATSVPSRVVAHERLPRTGHGKLDRSAAVHLPVGVGAPASPPTSTDDLAADIVSIWKLVLGRHDVDRETDFFGVGGDSLSAVEIVTEVEDLVGRPVPISTLLDGRTPAGIAALVSPERTAAPHTGPSDAVRLFVMQAGDVGAPLLVCTPGWDDVFGYRDLVDALPDHVRVIALSASDAGPDDTFTTVEALGAAFHRVLSAEAAPDLGRPIVVFGWSTGGVVAYELAGRLRDAGHGVSYVGLVDTFFPGAEQHLWSNRWWKYKTLLSPSAFVAEVATTVRRRARKYARAIGARLLEFAGTPVPDEPERTSSGGVPLEAFGYRPAPHGVPIVMYAATTTNPERTYVGWRSVAQVDVVPVEGRHRGYRSIMAADRVEQITTDLARRLSSGSVPTDR